MDPVREQLISFVFELLNAARSPEEVRALFDVISPKRQSNKSSVVQSRSVTGPLENAVDVERNSQTLRPSKDKLMTPHELFKSYQLEPTARKAKAG